MKQKKKKDYLIEQKNLALVNLKLSLLIIKLKLQKPDVSKAGENIKR